MTKKQTKPEAKASKVPSASPQEKGASALVIGKSRMDELVASLSKNYDVFAPVDDGTVAFKRIDSMKNVSFAKNSTKPPKGVLFPQTDSFFKFKVGKGKIELIQPDKEKKIAILGIRPCDARSLSVFDKVFAAGEFVDTYYADRRKNALLIGYACVNPAPNCFCTSFDINPGTAGDVDVLLTDIGDKYHVNAISEKGREVVKSAEKLFSKASAADDNAAKKVHGAAKGMIKRTANTKDLLERMDRSFESPLWGKTAARCLSCGICTFLCPTCYCFDIQDELRGETGTGARKRMWDACTFPEYTLHASGHNPRPARMNRLRNRFFHKLSYCPKNIGLIACVGCGRCVNNCPVNIDIIEIMDKVGMEKAAGVDKK